MPLSSESSWLREWTHVSYIFCIGRQVLYHWCHMGGPLHTFSYFLHWQKLRRKTYGRGNRSYRGDSFLANQMYANLLCGICIKTLLTGSWFNREEIPFVFPPTSSYMKCRHGCRCSNILFVLWGNLDCENLRIGKKKENEENQLFSHRFLYLLSPYVHYLHKMIFWFQKTGSVCFPLVAGMGTQAWSLWGSATLLLL